MGHHLMELRNHVDECEVCGKASEDEAKGGSFTKILAHCCDEGARLRARYYQDWEYGKEPNRSFRCGCRCGCFAQVEKVIGKETVPVWCSPCEEAAEDGRMPHNQGYVSKKFVFPVIRNEDGTPKTFPKLISEELVSTPEGTKALFDDISLHMATLISAKSLGEEFMSASVEGQRATIRGILEASFGTGKEHLCLEIIVRRLRELGAGEDLIEVAQSVVDEGE